MLNEEAVKNVSNIALTLSPFVTTKPVEDWFLAECHHRSQVGRKLISSFVLDHVAFSVANRMVLHTFMCDLIIGVFLIITCR